MIALADGGHGVLHDLAFGSTIDTLARTGELPLWVVTRPRLRETAPP